MEEREKKINIFEETMAHMTYLQIEEAVREGAIVLFPVGVIEEHGPHLPLAVDVYGSYLKSRVLKSELQKKNIKVIIAPPFYWGINFATDSFAGSFTCREETLISALLDVIENLKKWGFNQVLFINHHMDGKHLQTLDKTIQKGRKEIGIRAYLILDQLVVKRLGFKGYEPHLIIHKSFLAPGPPSPYLNIHAEAYETSFMWYYLPELVDFDVWKTLKPTNLNIKDLEIWRQGGNKAKNLTPQGYFGDPAAASPEKGKEEIEFFGKLVAEALEAFLQDRYVPPQL